VAVTGFLPKRTFVRAAGLFALFVTLGLVACSSAETFRGTVLTSENPASPFELSNQFGEHVSLEDRRGLPVVLTFLYTNCPDVCPLTTSLIRDAHEMLGEDADDVAILAVSVDPERDTEQAALDYSERWRMTRNWDFLVGQRERLTDIWKAYFVAASVDESSHAEQATGAGGGLAQDSVKGLSQAIEERYLVSHSAPVYLIDQEGTMRVLFTLPFEAEDLAHDVRLLLED
jgi:protein SCO1/2